MSGARLQWMGSAAVRSARNATAEASGSGGPVLGAFDFLVETGTYTPPAGDDVDFIVET